MLCNNSVVLLILKFGYSRSVRYRESAEAIVWRVSGFLFAAINMKDFMQIVRLSNKVNLDLEKRR